MRKGSIVSLRQDSWITEGVRSPTQEELDAWYASDLSKGMDSAGETKLPPRTAFEDVSPLDHLLVLRARASAKVGWGRPRPKHTLVVKLDSDGKPTGLPFYLPRRSLEEGVVEF